MKYILWIIYLILSAFFIYFAFVTVPVINSIFRCYDNADQNFDSIEVQSRSQGWSEERRCQIRFNQLLTTRKCIQEAKLDYPLKLNLDQVTKMLLRLRPGMSEISDLIVEHDKTCQNYPDTMFDPLRDN